MAIKEQELDKLKTEVEEILRGQSDDNVSILTKQLSQNWDYSISRKLLQKKRDKLRQILEKFHCRTVFLWNNCKIFGS